MQLGHNWEGTKEKATEEKELKDPHTNSSVSTRTSPKGGKKRSKDAKCPKPMVLKI